MAHLSLSGAPASLAMTLLFILRFNNDNVHYMLLYCRDVSAVHVGNEYILESTIDR